MEFAAALRAGEIAASIKVRLDKIAEIDRCIAENWRINEAWARTDGNQACNLVLSALDPTTNYQAMMFIRSVYEAQVAALQEELAVAENWTPPPPQEPDPTPTEPDPTPTEADTI